MASPVGLAIRNEKAQVRINDSLDLLADLLGVELPENPARSRDPFLREMLRMEWTAETLEVLAVAFVGRIEPLPESEEPEVESDEHPESELEQAEEAADADDVSDDQGPDDELDPVELKKLKLDELKAMAADRGIDGVQDDRSKDEVIEKLMEGTE